MEKVREMMNENESLIDFFIYKNIAIKLKYSCYSTWILKIIIINRFK